MTEIIINWEDIKKSREAIISCFINISPPISSASGCKIVGHILWIDHLWSEWNRCHCLILELFTPRRVWRLKISFKNLPKTQLSITYFAMVTVDLLEVLVAHWLQIWSQLLATTQLNALPLNDWQNTLSTLNDDHRRPTNHRERESNDNRPTFTVHFTRTTTKCTEPGRG